MLFMAEGDQEIKKIYAQEMEPFKMYNIKRSVWHTHTLNEDAMVLIIENRDTGLDNSPEIDLTDKERKKIIKSSLDFG
jgi:hypothetical protein